MGTLACFLWVRLQQPQELWHLVIVVFGGVVSTCCGVKRTVLFEQGSWGDLPQSFNFQLPRGLVHVWPKAHGSEMLIFILI